ncbi:MAG: DUF1571 domain-containing protein [Pirellulales bacterium]
MHATIAKVRAELAKLSEGSETSLDPKVRNRIQSVAEELRRLEEELQPKKTAATTTAKPALPDSAPQAPSRPIIKNHPFQAAIERARRALVGIEAIKDYSAVTVKLERDWSGKRGERQFMFAKIRHKPFSVYLRFLAPLEARDREVLFVEGKNDGMLLARESPNRPGLVGAAAALIGTRPYPPNGPIPMSGNRYPITEIGILNLTKRLVEVGVNDMQYAEAEAKYYPNAKVNERSCEAWAFIHPVKRPYFRFHRAEVFIDKELNLPIRYASYTWPLKEGDPPILLEEYTYTKLKLNNGFTDGDFDRSNPKYMFDKR